VYRLSDIIYSRQVALWATGLCCFYPSLLAYANLLLSETLFTFLLVVFTWLVVEAVRRDQIGVLVAAGVAMGLGALTRSILLLFLPFFVVYLLLCWNGNFARRFSAAAVAALAFTITIAPWAVRNTRVQQTLTFIDVMGGRNAMMGNYEHTPLERSWATFADVKGEQAWHRVLANKHQLTSPITQGQLDKLALRHAVEFVWSHPVLTAKRSVYKFFNFWQLERELLAAARAGYFSGMQLSWQRALSVAVCGGYALVLIAAVFGACCAPPRDVRLHYYLLMSILFPCAIHSAIFAHSRYHLPVVPLLSVYAAAAIVGRVDIWRVRRNWRFCIAAAICLILAIGWLRELLQVDSQAVQYFLA
jgi:4-amino-4-deoxy-L-arabinose transferase-like glycosyltransferase